MHRNSTNPPSDDSRTRNKKDKTEHLCSTDNPNFKKEVDLRYLPDDVDFNQIIASYNAVNSQVNQKIDLRCLNDKVHFDYTKQVTHFTIPNQNFTSGLSTPTSCLFEPANSSKRKRINEENLPNKKFKSDVFRSETPAFSPTERAITYEEKHAEIKACITAGNLEGVKNILEGCSRNRNFTEILLLYVSAFQFMVREINKQNLLRERNEQKVEVAKLIFDCAIKYKLLNSKMIFFMMVICQKNNSFRIAHEVYHQALTILPLHEFSPNIISIIMKLGLESKNYFQAAEVFEAYDKLDLFQKKKRDNFFNENTQLDLNRNYLDLCRSANMFFSADKIFYQQCEKNLCIPQKKKGKFISEYLLLCIATNNFNELQRSFAYAEKKKWLSDYSFKIFIEFLIKLGKENDAKNIFEKAFHLNFIDIHDLCTMTCHIMQNAILAKNYKVIITLFEALPHDKSARNCYTLFYYILAMLRLNQHEKIASFFYKNEFNPLMVKTPHIAGLLMKSASSHRNFDFAKKLFNLINQFEDTVDFIKLKNSAYNMYLQAAVRSKNTAEIEKIWKFIQSKEINKFGYASYAEFLVSSKNPEEILPLYQQAKSQQALSAPFYVIYLAYLISQRDKEKIINLIDEILHAKLFSPNLFSILIFSLREKEDAIHLKPILEAAETNKMLREMHITLLKKCDLTLQPNLMAWANKLYVDKNKHNKSYQQQVIDTIQKFSDYLASKQQEKSDFANFINQLVEYSPLEENEEDLHVWGNTLENPLFEMDEEWSNLSTDWQFDFFSSIDQEIIKAPDNNNANCTQALHSPAETNSPHAEVPIETSSSPIEVMEEDPTLELSKEKEQSPPVVATNLPFFMRKSSPIREVSLQATLHELHKFSKEREDYSLKEIAYEFYCSKGNKPENKATALRYLNIYFLQEAAFLADDLPKSLTLSYFLKLKPSQLKRYFGDNYETVNISLLPPSEVVEHKRRRPTD